MAPTFLPPFFPRTLPCIPFPAYPPLLSRQTQLAPHPLIHSPRPGLRLLAPPATVSRREHRTARTRRQRQSGRLAGAVRALRGLRTRQPIWPGEHPVDHQFYCPHPASGYNWLALWDSGFICPGCIPQTVSDTNRAGAHSLFAWLLPATCVQWCIPTAEPAVAWLLPAANAVV